jgi:hypothetical protein
MTIKHLFNPTHTYNNKWLFFLRVTVALFALLHFAAIQADFAHLFSFKGFVQPDIMSVSTSTYEITIYKIFVFINGYFNAIQYADVLNVFRYLYPMSLLCLAIGLFTRVSALFSLLLQLIFINSIAMYQYGADAFTTIMLFYCFIFPVSNQHSIDNIIFKNYTNISTKKYLYLIQTHICIAYFFSGLDKLIGFNWRNGEAIWKAINAYNELGLVDVSPYYNTPLFLIAGWATIIIELCYPLFINIQKTRQIWLVCTIGLHLSILLIMGLFFFSTIMIIFNLVAYYLPYLETENAALKSGNQVPNTHKETALTPVYALFD